MFHDHVFVEPAPLGSCQPAAANEWSDETTKLLISLYDDAVSKLKSARCYNKKRLWEQLSSAMLSNGYVIQSGSSPQQVDNTAEGV